MLDLSRYRALTFDCYGTLIDWEPGLLPILERWAERGGLVQRGEELLAVYGEAEAQMEREHPSLLYPDILRRVVRGMSRRFGVPEDGGAEDEIAGSVGEWPAFEDSPEALARLKRRYRLAILSNVDRASFARTNRRLGVEFDLMGHRIGDTAHALDDNRREFCFGGGPFLSYPFPDGVDLGGGLARLDARLQPAENEHHRDIRVLFVPRLQRDPEVHAHRQIGAFELSRGHADDRVPLRLRAHPLT